MRRREPRTFSRSTRTLRIGSWHQIARTDGFTFWGACGAIRTSAFHAVSGFDERYTAPSIEDIELGYRLRRAGMRIRVDPTLEVTHLKRWTAASLIRTDFVARALPWSELIFARGPDRRRPEPSDAGSPGRRWDVAARAVRRPRVLDPGSGLDGGRADGGPVPLDCRCGATSRGCGALPSRRRQSPGSGCSMRAVARRSASQRARHLLKGPRARRMERAA